ncbi:MAG: hypothetical protein GY858_08840 [Candidatus Omnitrophica bacterium]|nr:hypothetical protein [Candidatus Omnitrophota bacterium]
MKRLALLLIIACLPPVTNGYCGFDTVAVVAAIENQTAKDLAHHFESLQNMLEQLENLRGQLDQLQKMTDVAEWKREGLEAVGVIGDLRNQWLKNREFYEGISANIENMGNFEQEWKEIFGDMNKTLDLVGDINKTFASLAVSDKTNTKSYSLAESFQKKYDENSNYARQMAEGARGVNEKAALRQIAEELAHLLELQNQMLYLMSQMAKSQSVEFSNRTRERKAKIADFEEEIKGVGRFLEINTMEDFSIR